MITTIEQINNKLNLMDLSLSKTLESKDTSDLFDFNVLHSELHEAIYGNKFKGTKPTFTGLLHVQSKFIYLLNSLKYR